MIRHVLAYLQSLGHTKIAVVGLRGDIRYTYFFEALKEYRMRCPERWQVLFSGVFREGGELFDRLLKQSGGNLPTAILAHNDQMALAVMRRIHELGYSVPGDFSVIGNENIALAKESVPSLTSVSYADPAELAAKMVNMLLERKANPAMPLQRLLIEPGLVIRESCGAPKQ